jgi:uncharacterized protein YndB with AHSA1/START domain
MTPTHPAPSAPPDPRLDLVLERIVDVPPDLVWQAWTTPEHVMRWFTPAPWATVECEIDLRPGGAFRTVMRSPEGQDYPNVGCYLEIVPGRKLVWTDALLPGYRPSPATSLDAAAGELGGFTAVITIEPHPSGGTRYVAMAIHRDEAARDAHEKMGFHEGWGKALDQLVELARTLQAAKA